MRPWVLAIIVCPSVSLSHCNTLVLSKRLNVGSCKQCHVIAQKLYFSDGNSRWWVTSIPPEICAQSDPPPWALTCPCGRVVSALGRHVQYSVTRSVAEVCPSARVRAPTKGLFLMIPMHTINTEAIPGRQEGTCQFPSCHWASALDRYKGLSAGVHSRLDPCPQ